MDTNSLCKPCTAYIWPTNGAKVIRGYRSFCVSNRVRYVDHDRPVGIANQSERECVNSQGS